MGATFVLELQAHAAAAHGFVIGIVEQRRAAFAERDDACGVGRIVDVEREQGTKTPHIAALLPIPRGIRSFARESRQVQDHLDRTAVDLIEIHRHVG